MAAPTNYLQSGEKNRRLVQFIPNLKNAAANKNKTYLSDTYPLSMPSH
jgi:hypothetical protein